MSLTGPLYSKSRFESAAFIHFYFENFSKTRQRLNGSLSLEPLAVLRSILQRQLRQHQPSSWSFVEMENSSCGSCLRTFSFVKGFSASSGESLFGNECYHSAVVLLILSWRCCFAFRCSRCWLYQAFESPEPAFLQIPVCRAISGGSSLIFKEAIARMGMTVEKNQHGTDAGCSAQTYR